MGVERFKDYSAADALEPLLPIESLVDQLMQPASVSIMFGKPGTKKTYAMLWLAVCVALGKDWLGFKTRQSPVLFVDEESGHDRLHRRLHEVLLGAGGNAQTPIRWIPPSKFRFNEQEDLDALCSKILAREAKLVIIDSLAASSSGDENSKKDMQPVMSGARYIAERTGAHVAIIHHSPKSDNNNNGTPRGSSVFEAEPDLVLEMKSPQGSAFVTYATVKNRDGEAKKWAAQCHWNTNADPNLSTFSMEWAAKVESGERELSPLRQWILDYLEEKGESEMQAILDAGEQDGMGARLSIRDAIRILARDKLIYRTNPDEKGYGATAKYALTEPEEED